MRKLPALLIISLIANIALGFVLMRSGTENSATGDAGNYPFLSKRIFAESQNDILINFIPLRTAMRDYVNEQNGTVSAYFEYLPSGTSICANDQMEVKIASLVKIPVVMAAYKNIENGSLKKEQQLTLQQK